MKLAVFDFDNTLIDVNSDTFIDKLLSNRDALITPPPPSSSSSLSSSSVSSSSISSTSVASDGRKFKYPSEIEALTSAHGWTARMNAVFSLMHAEYGIGVGALLDCVRQIRIADGMLRLLALLRERGYTLAIASDANAAFIDAILQSNGVADWFAPHNIFTNTVDYSDGPLEQARLVIRPFNETFARSCEHICDSDGFCTANICKGAVLRALLTVSPPPPPPPPRDANTSGNHVIYVGDGHNDYCPALLLTPGDSYFVRDNYSLARLLTRRVELAARLAVTPIYWSTGVDILNALDNVAGKTA